MMQIGSEITPFGHQLGISKAGPEAVVTTKEEPSTSLIKPGPDQEATGTPLST